MAAPINDLLTKGIPMNEKEIAEIKRRFRAQRSNINHIRGCCVNTEGEIISEFDQSLSFLTDEETEKILTTLRKTLSGYIGRNLIDIEFSTKQVLESEEHKMLMDIKNSSLSDTEAVHKLYDKIRTSVSFEENYIILLAVDKYDVIGKHVDGEADSESGEVFTYFVCAVCPIKASKSQLGFYVSGNPFRNISADTVVSAPELGFMFPTFDDRSTNIYKAMFYTRSTEADNTELIDNLFKSEVIPMPADTQGQTFSRVLEDSAGERCTLNAVKSIYNQVNEVIAASKEHKDEDPILLDKSMVKEMLESGGVDEETVAKFEEKFKDEFGDNARIAPRTLIATNKFQVKTPDVVIKVDPKRTDLIKTRIIDGEKYILISAEETIEVNGVNIEIV